MPKLRITFNKTGVLRYISHLDLMRLFERACRRAKMPLKLTQGFNPHPKISVFPAVALGTEHDDLKADILLERQMEPSQVQKRLNEVLPGEVRVVDVCELRKVKQGGKTKWV